MSSDYYVIQVKTRGEEKYLKYAKSVIKSENIRMFWPRRSLRIRKKGIWQHVFKPIFPGYVFVKVDSIRPELYWSLKKLPGFFRFLENNHNILPLPENEDRILTSLLRFGEIIQKSVAEFSENNRITILEGPLRDLMGRIVKVDRRKGRAKVKLDLYEKSYLVDFGFSILGKIDNDRKSEQSHL